MASAESSPEEPDLSHELPASLLFVPTLNTGSTKQGFQANHIGLFYICPPFFQPFHYFSWSTTFP